MDPQDASCNVSDQLKIRCLIPAIAGHCFLRETFLIAFGVRDIYDVKVKLKSTS